MTRQQNLQHAIDTGLRRVVDSSGKALYIDKSKPVMVTVLDTGEVRTCSSAKEAAELTGVSPRTVQYNAFIRKKTVSVSGFTFTSPK